MPSDWNMSAEAVWTRSRELNMVCSEMGLKKKYCDERMPLVGYYVNTSVGW